jgi:hypothetical protein
MKTITCNQCGQSFQRNKSAIKSINYCSKSCYYSSKFKGISTANYRKIVLSERMCVCEACGQRDHDKLLDIHHLDENRANNNSENLILLCVRCHAAVTRKLAFFRGNLLCWKPLWIFEA